MPLVKVKRFSQVTLPSEVRKQFKIVVGDYLEAEAVKDGILLKPVSVVEKKGAWKDLFEVIDRVNARNPKPRKSAKQEEEEIAQIIKEYRKTARKQKTRA
ncbi:MAG: AbrB/MazE/SpoVT family DNA-binding domain-containing protein [Acidobacteriota bacterium]